MLRCGTCLANCRHGQFFLPTETYTNATEEHDICPRNRQPAEDSNGKGCCDPWKHRQVPLATSDFEWLNVVSVGEPHPGKRPPGWIILKLATTNLPGMVTFRPFNAESESLTAASLQLFTSLKFSVSLISASQSETTEGKFGNLGRVHSPALLTPRF